MASCKKLLQCLQQMLTNTQQQAEAFDSVAEEKLSWGLYRSQASFIWELFSSLHLEQEKLFL